MKEWKTILKKPNLSAATLILFLAASLLAIVLGFSIVRLNALYIIAGIVGTGTLFLILRSPWTGFLLFAFSLPFERIGSIDIGGFTLRASQFFLASLCVSLFLRWARTPKERYIPSYPVALPLIAYAIVAGFALLYAPNLMRSVSVLLFVLFTMLASVIVPIFVHSEERVVKMLRVVFAALAVVGVFGIYQFVGDLIGLPPALTGLRELYTKEILGFPRVQSTALEPLYFANYLLLPLSVLLSLFFAQSSRVLAQWKVIALLGLGLLNLLLTVARGGYIAFAVSVGVVVLYYFLQLRLLTARVVAILAAALLVLGVAVTQVVDVEVVAEQAASHIVNIFEGASFNERAITFEQAQEIIVEHPWIGIGAGSFGPYVAAHPYMIPPHGWAIVNNIYLEVLAETGVLGFLALFSGVVILIVRTLHALRYTQSDIIRVVLVGAFAAFAGVLVQYNTFSILYIMHIWFLVGLLIALQNVALSKNENTAALVE